jgi:hypothetical protein
VQHYEIQQDPREDPEEEWVAFLCPPFFFPLYVTIGSWTWVLTSLISWVGTKKSKLEEITLETLGTFGSWLGISHLMVLENGG